MRINDNHKIQQRIRKAFSRAAVAYDTYSGLQEEVARELIEKVMDPLSGRQSIASVLDIGCGTGHLTFHLSDYFPNASITGLDIAAPMLRRAAAKDSSRNIHLIAADCTSLPYKKMCFDMVTSSLAYQWVPDPGAAFKETFRVLNSGGIFALATLGPQTLHELRRCYEAVKGNNGNGGLPPLLNYSSTDTLLSTMEETGYRIHRWERSVKTRRYKGLLDLLKTIKTIGAGNPYPEGDKSLARGSTLKDLGLLYEGKFIIDVDGGVGWSADAPILPRRNGGIPATYEIISIIALKH